MAFKVLWLRGTCNGVAIKEKIYFQRGYRVRSAKKPNQIKKCNKRKWRKRPESSHGQKKMISFDFLCCSSFGWSAMEIRQREIAGSFVHFTIRLAHLFQSTSTQKINTQLFLLHSSQPNKKAHPSHLWRWQ